MDSLALINATRTAGQLQTFDPVYTNTEILRQLTLALINRFADPVSRLRQGYWVQKSITTAGTSNTTGLYRLPARSVVQGLEKLEVSNNGGAGWWGLSIITQPQATGNFGSGNPGAYALEADCVRVYPTPTGNFDMRFTYYLRPPELITYVNTCRVVSTTSTQVVTSSDPTAVSIAASSGCDIQNSDGSHELAVVGEPFVLTGPSLGLYTLTFPSSVDLSRVRVGDYVRAPDQAVFPMLPREFHQALCDYTAAVIWASKGDFEKSRQLNGKAEADIGRAISMAQPRIKSAPFNFTNPNSFLRRNLGRR